MTQPIKPPTLLDRSLRALAYLFASSVGVYIMLDPPGLVTQALGPWPSAIWALMMMSGIPAAWFAFREKFRGEYSSLVPLIFALLVALLATWLKVPAQTDMLPRVAIASALECLLIVRLSALHRLTSAVPEHPVESPPAPVKE